MALGYPQGLIGKDIPLEGQIIRVADEYDAIVSKRQYKSHIGITDTLKILIHNSEVVQNVTVTGNMDALGKLSESAKVGKINKKVLKYLFRVVIDDTEYEISQIYDYVDYLKENIDRLQELDEYYKKSFEQTKEDKKEYYLEGVRMLLHPDETIENYQEVLAEYTKAYITRKEIIDNLFLEVKNIKKLKI